MRAAAAMGLLTVQERRREGQKNLPNIIRIVSREWQLWIKRGGPRSTPPNSKAIGFKKTDPTGKGFKKRGQSGIPPEASEPRLRPQDTWKNRRMVFGKAEGV
jgi:TFIIF-interacting CTD phosphatase-like protein